MVAATWSISRDDFDDGLGLVLQQKAKSEVELAGFQSPLFPQPSWRVGRLSAECMNREEDVPADGESREGKSVNVDLCPAEALVAFEALLLLPQHHQEVPAEGVAPRILERLAELRITRVARHSSLSLVQPAAFVAEIRLYVRV